MHRWLILALALAMLHGTPAAAETPADYAPQVKPLLQKRCYSCHGALKQESGLRLDTGKLIRQGGDDGPAVLPGNTAGSRLIQRVTAADKSMRMPPEGEPLTEREIDLLKAWIADGARSPDDEKPQPDPRQHWAFKKPLRSRLPKIDSRYAASVSNPIDSFLAADLQAKSLQPLPEAERHVLLRRLYIDLIGLPPSREELLTFVSDSSPDAYEKVVDRLLGSPQYAERWARHWMDVWRYSDWYGRRSVPDVMNSYPQIWRWRDWIVRSLADDKPYDRMLQEMLAADELAPGDDEAVVATGFLVRNWFKWNYEQWMKDNVEHTGKAFLGLTLNCCHCHDHKYDPIRQEEYFRFRAFFEPLELRQDRVPGLPDPGPFEKYVYTKAYGPIKAGLIRVFDEKPDAPTYMYERGDARNRMAGKPPVKPGGPALLAGDKLDISPLKLPAEAYYPGLKEFVRDEELAKARAALAAAKLAAAQDSTASGAPTVAEAEAKLRAVEARIAADDAKYRGLGDAAALARAAHRAEKQAVLAAAQNQLAKAERDQAAAGKPAGDGKPAAVAAKLKQQVDAARAAVAAAQTALAKDGDTYTPLSPIYPATSSGRRLALARWITSRDNPLPARVAVNHLWSWHFGRPLVETTSNFGQSGRPPTHPALLDWLAVELMDGGWRMKPIHRLIVTSAAYRRSSQAANGQSPQSADAAAGREHRNIAVDRDNRFYWRFPPQRMEAEVVRDAVLGCSGELEAALGGQELDHQLGLTSRRRSLYFAIHGEAKMEFLDLFDGPNVCDCYRRTTSVLPQQALAMSNSDLLLQQSRVLAGKLWADSQQPHRSDEQRLADFIRAAFEQVLTRPPTEQEALLTREFLAEQAALFQTGAKNAGAPPTGRGKDSPPTGLPGLSSAAAQRARESLIHALFNHNDFVTIR